MFQSERRVAQVDGVEPFQQGLAAFSQIVERRADAQSPARVLRPQRGRREERPEVVIRVLARGPQALLEVGPRLRLFL